MSMNKYYIGFFFKDYFETVTFNANQLANTVIGETDDIINFMCDEDEQYHGSNFTSFVDDKIYVADFNKPTKLNIYYGDNNDENDGFIVEENVPWILLKIEDENGKDLYVLTDNI